MTSPAHPSGTDRIAEAVRVRPEKFIINWQGDEPEFPGAAIVTLAETLAADEHLGMATLGYPLTAAEAENPHLVKIVCDDQDPALYFSRAKIPYPRDGAATAPPYLGHCGVYGYRRATLEQIVALPPGVLEQTEKLEQLRALAAGIKIRVRRLPSAPPKGIDTAADYADFVHRWQLREP
jgi:3-deoxy-manno-octulosonate cytidylyltransferase (CMP-KDO synthetase)